MRPWTEKTYGIPPEQVIGSSAVTRYEMARDGVPVQRRPGLITAAAAIRLSMPTAASTPGVRELP
jgi:hypothetical protein